MVDFPIPAQNNHWKTERLRATMNAQGQTGQSISWGAPPDFLASTGAREGAR